jgi:hypothetical protein
MAAGSGMYRRPKPCTGGGAWARLQMSSTLLRMRMACSRSPSSHALRPDSMERITTSAGVILLGAPAFMVRALNPSRPTPIWSAMTAARYSSSDKVDADAYPPLLP